MELRLLETTTPESVPPEPKGWERLWHGFFQLEKTRSEEARAQTVIANIPPVARPMLTMRQVEEQVFLNTVLDVDKETITLFELGAGRGDWCLALAGIIEHRLIPCTARSYRCLAIEGEPTHVEWTRTHFEKQRMNAVAVHGAVTAHDSWVRFAATTDPASHYGQAIDERGGNLAVRAYTIDTLMAEYGFDHLDIVHMDVQGEEHNALVGAKRALAEGRIDYVLIATHDRKMDFHETIPRLLAPAFKTVFDVPPKAGVVDTAFGEAFFPIHGLLALKRKAIP